MLESDANLDRLAEVEGYKVLPPCVLYGKIGQGGMGAVYRGRHLNLDIDVAVKCLKPDLTGEDEQFVVRFRREARSAARINHQNVVRVFDVSEENGLHYIVMELVQGETARQRVQRKGPLKVGEALEILHGAAAGLGEAHGKGFIHRDIKPDNIMISSGGSVKVADLGLAKPSGVSQMSMVSGTNVVMGTPQYMPPEQWENTATVTPAADVWALGATLYYLLVAGEAVGKDSLPRIMQRIVLQPFPDVRDKRPDVPDDVAAFIKKATEKDPGARFADAVAMREAIERLETRRESLRDADATSDGLQNTLLSPPPAKTLAKIKFWLDENASGKSGARAGAARGAAAEDDEGRTVISKVGARRAKPDAAARGGAGRWVAVLLLAVVAAGLGFWQPWKGAGDAGGPLAAAQRMIAEHRYEEALAETTRAFAADPALPGREQRFAELHLSWAQHRLDEGDGTAALRQLAKSSSFAALPLAPTVRQAALAVAGAKVDEGLTRLAPTAANPAPAGDGPVTFSGRLAAGAVRELRIGGRAVDVAKDGAFSHPVEAADGAGVQVEATLETGDVVRLAPWLAVRGAAIEAAPQAPDAPEIEMTLSPEQLVLVGDAAAELTIEAPADAELEIDGRVVTRRAGSTRHVHTVRSTRDVPAPVSVVVRRAGAAAGRSVPVTREDGVLRFVEPVTTPRLQKTRGDVVGTDADTVELRGTLSAKADRLLVGDDELAGVRWDGASFRVRAPLAAGTNRLRVVAERRFHAPVSQDVVVERVAAPALRVAEDTRTRDSVAGATYRVVVDADRWTDRVEISGGDVRRMELQRDAGGDRFRCEVPLVMGANTFELRANNAFGAVGDLTLTITRAATATARPVAVESPGGPAAATVAPRFSGVRMRVDGELVELRAGKQAFFREGTPLVVESNDENAEVFVNGAVAARGADGTVSLLEHLVESEATRVRLELRNAAGTSQPFEFFAWRDTTLPELAFDGPATVAKGKAFTLTGTWKDGGGLRRGGAVVGEVPATLSPRGVAKQGTWRVEHPGLEQSGTLTLVVVDRAGNEATLELPVTVLQ